VKLAQPGKIKDNIFVGEPRVDFTSQRPVAVSAGVHVVGAALPHPDLSDPITAIGGACKRFLSKPPDAEPDLLARFRSFVQGWLKDNLVPLPSDSNDDFYHWLDNTNYPLWRRSQLINKYEQITDKFRRRYKRVSNFVKDEFYREWKHARGINSRSDEFKCLTGPIFKLIEEVVYQHPSFIKHVPVAERPDYIYNLLFREGSTYFASDYSSYEALFTPEMMDSCEFELYRYMVQNLPGGADWLRLIECLKGRNLVVNKYFDMKVDGTRMSGEMCTSLGNGFTNLMLMLFLCKLKGCTDVNGVVEGDDGLFALNGSPPTSEDFAKLGFIIKIQTFTDLSQASFCGLIFDTGDRINIACPLRVLATTGWLNRFYVNSKSTKRKRLLRCKALSLLQQYPGAPIIQSFAQYILRCTRGINIGNILDQDRSLNFWRREVLLKAIRDERNIKPRVVPMNTRLLMEKIFNVPLLDQLYIEKYFDQRNELGPIDDPVILSLMPDVWHENYDCYSRPYPVMVDPPDLPGRDPSFKVQIVY